MNNQDLNFVSVITILLKRKRYSDILNNLIKMCMQNNGMNFIFKLIIHKNKNG